MNTNQLSVYTIAANCTDLSDIACGIDEMKAYFSKVAKPTATALVRFAKLHAKLEKLSR